MITIKIVSGGWKKFKNINGYALIIISANKTTIDIIIITNYLQKLLTAIASFFASYYKISPVIASYCQLLIGWRWPVGGNLVWASLMSFWLTN